jgi:excisionase family DNA binding protein
MLTQQDEALIGRMRAVIEQSHGLQLEMLEMWRTVLQSEAPADTTQSREKAVPALGVTSVGPELPDKPTFTIEEVGKMLGVSRPAAYRAAQRGEIPTLRLGRRLLVPRSALVSMLSVGGGH